MPKNLKRDFKFEQVLSTVQKQDKQNLESRLPEIKGGERI